MGFKQAIKEIQLLLFHLMHGSKCGLPIAMLLSVDLCFQYCSMAGNRCLLPHSMPCQQARSIVYHLFLQEQEERCVVQFSLARKKDDALSQSPVKGSSPGEHLVSNEATTRSNESVSPTIHMDKSPSDRVSDAEKQLSKEPSEKESIDAENMARIRGMDLHEVKSTFILI